MNNDASSDGGAIYCNDANPVITNCTIAENSAVNSGGGIYAESDAVPDIRNSIIWDNSPDGLYTASSAVVNYSDIQEYHPGSGNLNQDPLFVTGPGGSYYLSQTASGQPQQSICIDAGGDNSNSVRFDVFDKEFHLDDLITRTDQISESGTVDMGFHYLHVDYYSSPTPAPTNTPTPAPPTPTPTPTATPQILNVPYTYLTIQSGIDAASNRDIVVVADGVFSGAGNMDLDFNGKAITVRSSGGPANCFIDCTENGRGVYFHSGEDRDSVFRGFTIINGRRVGGSFPDNYGGGILCAYDTAPLIEDCVIMDCHAGAGGGVYCSADAAPMIRVCTMSGNTANSGAGIQLSDCAAELEGCFISGNIATLYGGGVYARDMVFDAKITSCEISGNSAGIGAGVCCKDSPWAGPVFVNCIVYGNFSDQGAGIACIDDSYPYFTACTITDNTATFEGGGLFCENDSDPFMTLCIIYSNTSGSGESDVHSIASDPNITWSDVGGSSVFAGTGNFNQNPLFISGNLGDYYLEQTSKSMSPCVDAGDTISANICFFYGDEYICMRDLSTRTDGLLDSDDVDIGYHYLRTLFVPDEFPSIQSAIDQAVAGQTVLLADGTYTGDRNKNLDFFGKGITVASMNGPDNCVIDCENAGRGFFFKNFEHNESSAAESTSILTCILSTPGIMILIMARAAAFAVTNQHL